MTHPRSHSNAKVNACVMCTLSALTRCPLSPGDGGLNFFFTHLHWNTYCSIRLLTTEIVLRQFSHYFGTVPKWLETLSKLLGNVPQLTYRDLFSTSVRHAPFCTGTFVHMHRKLHELLVHCSATCERTYFREVREKWKRSRPIPNFFGVNPKDFGSTPKQYGKWHRR